MEMLIQFPVYMEELIGELEKHDFIVHSFPLPEWQSVYSPGDYVYNKAANGVHYELVIDTNILHFLLRATEGVCNKKTRPAVGLVAFCQMAEIEIDPAMAIYELINYDKTRAQEAVEKLLLFEKINNADNEQLAEYCLGLRQEFELPDTPLRNKDDLVENLTKYRRLLEWDNLYLIVLKIVKLKLSDTARDNKIVELTQWMYYEFTLVITATAYSAFFFGKKPIKNVMKYKANGTADERQKSIVNMTWDLFIITQYFRKWIGNQSNDEFLYGSDDKAFREVLRLGIDVNVAQNITPLKHYLKDSVYSQLEKLHNEPPPKNEREYFVAEDQYSYRSNMISQYENDLGIAKQS